jgi:hypothetical protein
MATTPEGPPLVLVERVITTTSGWPTSSRTVVERYAPYNDAAHIARINRLIERMHATIEDIKSTARLR